MIKDKPIVRYKKVGGYWFCSVTFKKQKSFSAAGMSKVRSQALDQAIETVLKLIRHHVRTS